MSWTRLFPDPAAFVRALPNLLSCLRIVLTPAVVYLLLSNRCALAVPVTLVTGLTDTADGYLARRMGAESRLGALLDPLADKILLTSLYVAFSVTGLAPVWLAWLVVGRDLLILTMAAFGAMLAGMRDFPPSVWGKVSTVVQIAASLLLLGHCAGYLPWPEVVSFSVWTVAAATVWSGIHYVWYGVTRLRAGEHQV